MRDIRAQKLADMLINFSLKVGEGKKILIDIWDGAEDFAVELVDQVYKVGGIPFVNLETARVKRALMMGATEQQMEAWYNYELQRMKDMDFYIAIRKQDNISELSDVPGDRMVIYNKYYGMLHLQERCRSTRWCVLRYPSASMAQQAQMSTEAFEDYYFRVCGMDYDKLSKCMDPLKDLMDRTNKVHMKAAGTDLTFSIEGFVSGKCDGHANVPDGEVCTAVVKDSVNGTITYNIPTSYQGFVFNNVCFTFKDGKIIKATANDTDRLNKILDTDEGARYIGEFAIGVNPYVNRYIIDTLFDEKMTGSIHFTPGNGGKNQSSIHWDIIQCHTPEYGGGEIWFDDKLIRKDGLFVVDELLGLNPDIFMRELKI